MAAQFLLKEKKGERRKTSGKGRHLGEKVSEKRRRSSRDQSDDGESDDGEEHGKRSSRDKEGEDTEDIYEGVQNSLLGL